MNMRLTKDCKHGRLQSTCEICAEIEALVQQRDALDAEATRLSDHATELRTRRDKLAAENKTLRDALEGIVPFIPVTSASEGGAAKHSANVRAADAVRAALGETK